MPRRKAPNTRNPGSRPGPNAVGKRRREQQRMLEDMDNLQMSSDQLDPRLIQSLLSRLADLLDSLEEEPPTPKEENGLEKFFKTIGDTLESVLPMLGPLFAML